MIRALLGAAVFAAAATAPIASAQCPGDPGIILDMTPNLVPVGTGFDVNIKAPVGNLVVLIVSPSPGPTATPYGSLCVGLPAGLFAFIQPVADLTFPHPIECRAQFVGLKGYFQVLTVSPSNPGVVLKSNSEQIEIIDGACDLPPEPGDFVTYTQGGWGTTCSPGGNNPGCLRDQNFSNVFPQGVIIGDQDGPDADTAFAAWFQTSLAVENYLPSTKTPKALAQDDVNPTATASGTFGGQLLSAKLNVGFDDAGVFDSTKNDPSLKLKDLVFVANVHAKLIGKTVAEVIQYSDDAISGAIAVPMDVDGDSIGDVGYQELSDALDKLNNCFDNGTQALGTLGIHHFGP